MLDLDQFQHCEFCLMVEFCSRQSSGMLSFIFSHKLWSAGKPSKSVGGNW